MSVFNLQKYWLLACKIDGELFLNGSGMGAPWLRLLLNGEVLHQASDCFNYRKPSSISHFLIYFHFM